MNQRDQELLNKQFRWPAPPPRTDGVLSFTIIAIVVGMSVSIGAIAFARQTNPAQIVLNDSLAEPSCLQFSKSEILPRLH
jgi:hypothetical protein